MKHSEEAERVAALEEWHDKAVAISYRIGYWDGVMTLAVPALVATLVWLVVYK